MNSPAADKLEREIDITRRAVDRTLTALQFELSPRRRAQVAWRRAKRRTESSLRSGADWAVANRASVSLGAVAVIAACVAAAWWQGR